MNKHGDGHFPNTRWTLIQRLKDDREDVSRRALEELCSQYHYPLYCYIRRRNLDHHDAEDALQDFLAKLLRLGSFRTAEAEKGRLRSFLSTALSHFLINWRRDQRRQISSASLAIDIDTAQLEDRYQQETFADSETPERVFDRKWSQELLRKVALTLKGNYQDRGKLELYLELQPVLFHGGSLRGEDTAQIAAKLNLTEGNLRVALNRMLKSYRDILESEVSQTVSDRNEVKGEISALIAAFNRS